MKQKVIFFLFFLFTISCKSQKNNLENKTIVEEKVLTTFLNQIKPYTYLDKNVSRLNLINEFIGKYNKTIHFYNLSDSICNKSSDVEKLQFYCPLADTFYKYTNILSTNDLDYLAKKKSLKKENNQLAINKILLNTTTPILNHSEEYYNDENYNSSLPFRSKREFPSLRIYNIYFNENKTVAIIAYNIIDESILHGLPSFYILIKQKNIWWKPIGDLKL